jgi:hypothetical protein
VRPALAAILSAPSVALAQAAANGGGVGWGWAWALAAVAIVGALVFLVTRERPPGARR